MQDLSTQPPDPPGRYWFAGRWRRYNYARVIGRLGTLTDTQLAAEISMTDGGRQMRKFRDQLGIAAHDRFAKLDPHLGRIPDARLARHFRVDPRTVARRRQARGIPPAGRRRAHADRLLREYVSALHKTETEES